MTRILIALTTLFMAASTTGCGNSKESSEETPAHIAEARERFGEDFACEPNVSEDYILCAHRPGTTTLSPIPQVAFFVFDVNAGEIAFEQRQVTGEVRWTDDYEIEMTLTPGIVTSDGRGAPKYRIDVRSGDRRRLDGVDAIPE